MTIAIAVRQRLRRTWLALVGELHDPDLELTIEEFAALLSTYKQLQATGYKFDPATAALMAVLERQATDTEDALEDDTDSDEDKDDCDRELDGSTFPYNTGNDFDRDLYEANKVMPLKKTKGK